jgi:D-alanyl-D-alanine carboxypeptidase (penicillin-binding protein 5/6)
MFDGVKTGYTRAAGHCLVGSSTRDDMRLIAVVLGSGIDKRFADVRALVGYGYQYFKTREIVSSGDVIDSLSVIAGNQDSVSVGVDKSVVMTLKKNIDLELQILAQERIVAPVIGGTTAGTLKIIDEDGNIINESELIFLEDIEKLGFFQYWFALIWDWIKSLFI